MADPRLLEHAARHQILAYCGIPLLDAEGVLLGTLCHYDTVPRDPDRLDLELLLQVASTLALGAHVPPYPVA
jgi:GAF domain-containing protein